MEFASFIVLTDVLVSVVTAFCLVLYHLNCGSSHLHSIMEGEESLQQYSPEVMVQDPIAKNAVSLLPPIVLFHGTADYSIPSDSRFESHLVIRRLLYFYLCALDI